jgi:hypothetical protein
VLTLAAAGVALACGFDFPVPLLENREEILLGLRPTDWLTTQIEDLVPRLADNLKAGEDNGVTADSVEQNDFGQSRGPQLAAMRAGQDGASAYAAGEGFPEAARLYIAGAIEFKAAAADDVAKADSFTRSASAFSYFERVLQLPETERAPRVTWASYMAGRALRLSSDPAARERASTYFQMTRELALKGLPDPLSLAVSSYGEEGRVALEKGDIARAMELYLEQAARGSQSARESLQLVSARLMADPELTLRYIEDPRIRKLWFAGVLAESGDTFYVDRGPYDALDSRNNWVINVNKVSAALDRTKTPQLDQLAAVAYGTGRFELAASLAAGVNTPMASVVRAKLALRAGDFTAAAKEYAAAVSRQRQANVADNMSLVGGQRLMAENGVLAVSRGDYADALRNLVEAGSQYWLDAAYVAERILTLDELTAVVSQHFPAGTARGKAPLVEGENYYGAPPDSAKALRLLLARRQMREKRFDEALESFRNDDFAIDGDDRSAAALADEYVKAVRGSTENWTRVDRAGALFAAGVLAQEFGMELMGYELAPDYAAFSGSMTRGSEPAPAGDYAGVDEPARYSATAPPETRFHYRRIALDLARRSADNLPARSQAFAAVLCTSLRWTRSSNDTATESAIYQRYVREGAYVDWSPKFGGRCEAPDFERASAFVWHKRVSVARVALRPYKIPLVVLTVVALAGIAVVVVRRRKAAA